MAPLQHASDAPNASRARRLFLWVIPGALLLMTPACATSPSPTEEALFRIGACGDQTFHVLIQDEEVISEAESLVGQGEQRIVTGELRRGNGGFNEPYSWHLDADTVGFADITIEVCDGCPQMVQEDLDYWIGTVGRFCPWTTRVLQRVR